ncbi:MAG: sialate O-acetylesterase [Aureliella sp.]
MNSKLLLALAILLFSAAAPTHLKAEEFLLFYLGGQSNMEGFGSVVELPQEMNGPTEDVYIYHTQSTHDRKEFQSKTIWKVLTPGHGTDYRATGENVAVSSRFGVELSFASEMKKLYPGRKIAIIKYARNGSSISADSPAKQRWGCWEPDFAEGTGELDDINQYDHFLATLRDALRVPDIDKDGETDTLIPQGIVWMQGESDATATEEVAKAYAANLKRLMDLMRAAFRQDDLPVVIGQISDSGQNARGRLWTHLEILQSQQQLFAKEDKAANIVQTTANYSYSDPAHYDSAGYLDLGRQFARSMHELMQE